MFIDPAVPKPQNIGPLTHIFALAAMVLVLGACTAEPPPAAPADDPVLQAGQEIYATSCRGCHRANGSGGSGPRLNEGRVIERFPDIADQIALVADGKGGMPAYGDRLSADELEAVVRYTREVLSSPPDEENGS